ncbi:MAG: HupE/UreJ family protein [Pseudomonadota bacterium]
MIRFIAGLIVALLSLAPSGSEAHTLGVDRAELVEISPGSYRLVSKVPQRIAPAIRAPDLPATCTQTGRPRGERGSYSVTFTFTCDPALTAEDEIHLPWQREGALLTVQWLDQEPVTRLARREGAEIVVPLAEWQAGSGSVWRAASRYTVLGTEHILMGLDHLLFVLALLFVVQGKWKLVKTITAFTVAHSITLALATLGYISLPSAPVEAAIALSIVFLATEIIQHERGQSSLTFRKPWLVAFAFGLLHGLGFAGALSDIGLPPPEVPIALLFFNIGVEIGQLIFVAAILFLGWTLRTLVQSDKAMLRARQVVVYMVGTAAMYWCIERTVGIFA